MAAAADAFPVLGTRLSQVAGTLSGGQAQMLAVADYVYVLHKGRVAFAGDPADCQRQRIFDQYLGGAA